MHSPNAYSLPRSVGRGFTLVELLVVIGIIAVLISILLPALGNARKSANTAKCAANLRSIVQGVNLYAAQWNGAIPGGPWTSARFVKPSGNITQAAVQQLVTNGQFNSVIGFHDWMSPIARVMGVKFNEGGTEAARLERFQKLRDIPMFNCPENQFLATQFVASTPGGNLVAPTGLMISYNTAIVFQLQRNPGTTSYPSGRIYAFDLWNPPASYNNTVAKIGSPSLKVYIADGGKFSNGGSPPSFNLGVDVTHGGAFADQPPVTGFTQSWGRSRTPANRALNTGTLDERGYAYRHGKTVRDGRGDTGFKINLGFFDGHVETLGDLEASNPVFWYPKGTELDTSAAPSGGRPQIYPDVKARFLPNVTGKYVVP